MSTPEERKELLMKIASAIFNAIPPGTSQLDVIAAIGIAYLNACDTSGIPRERALAILHQISEGLTS